MYGTGRGYLDTLLTEDGGAKVTTFHNELNPLFGGHHPEPDAAGMAEVSQFVKPAKPSSAWASMATPTASASWTKTAPGLLRTKCLRSHSIT